MDTRIQRARMSRRKEKGGENQLFTTFSVLSDIYVDNNYHGVSAQCPKKSLIDPSSSKPQTLWAAYSSQSRCEPLQ